MASPRPRARRLLASSLGPSPALSRLFSPHPPRPFSPLVCCAPRCALSAGTSSFDPASPCSRLCAWSAYALSHYVVRSWVVSLDRLTRVALAVARRRRQLL